MIEVNLLQTDKKRAAAGGRQGGFDPTKPLLFLAFAVVLGAAAMLNFTLVLKMKGQEAALEKLVNQRKEPEHLAQLAKADELQEELDKLNRKAVIIEDLITNRINWAKKLSALRDNLPGDIWIEEVELESTKNPKDTVQTLRVEAATLNADRGFARSAETLESLRNSEEFMSGLTGDLDAVQSTNSPWSAASEFENLNQDVWRFTMVAKRPLPESEKPKDPKEKKK